MPVLMLVLKFISSSTASGRNCSRDDTSVAGDGMVFTSAKCIGNKISNARRIPRLSSTTSIFPTLEAIVKLTLYALARVKFRSIQRNIQEPNHLRNPLPHKTVKNPYTNVKNLYKDTTISEKNDFGDVGR